MIYAYGAGGLTLVADRGLYGLPPVAPAAADIRVHVDARPSWAVSHAPSPYYASPNVNERGTPSLQVSRADAGYVFTFVDGASFWIDGDGSEIWMTFATTVEDACTYLAGPVLSFALRLRREFSLHASAVAFGDRAVAFAGAHGAGKSTTAAALGRRGHAVMTDDILRLTPIETGWQAHSFGNLLRLWPDAEPLVFGSAGTLERLTPFWDKRAVAIGAGGVPAAPASLPLAGIAFLSPDEFCTAAVIRPLPSAAALIRLAANSSAGYLLDGPGRRAEFDQIASIAATVPGVDVARPANAVGNAEWLEMLIDWASGLPRAGVPV
jgi:hypothetical protein